ncbi:MAG: PAS domain-containing protein [Balneolaceae bacterium]
MTHFMMLKEREIKQIYYKGLKDYLVYGSEEILTAAYQQSRELLKEDFSELDIITLHHQILSDLLDNGLLSDRKSKIKKASAYLKEWISPYEVKIQSYRALIEELNKKNKQLKEEIARRKEAQEKLQENNTYFHTLIENAQDIITVLDTHQVIRYNSPSVERILGYKQDEILNNNAFLFVHPDDVKVVEKIFNEIKKSPNAVRSAVFRFRHKKGKWIYLESFAKHVPKSPDGAIIVINSRDITTRIQRVQKLKEHRSKLAEAQQIAKVGSWEWTINGEHSLEWSDEMCRIYGFSPGNFDCSYNTFLTQLHPADRAQVEKKIQIAIDEQRPFSFEHRIIRLDGGTRTLLNRGRVIIDDNGEVVKLIGIAQDITEQKEKEQKLREYSERLRKLSERVERTREEERIRIAREIHDELGQMLTVLKMDISMMSDEMRKKVPDDILEYFNEEAEKILKRINTIIGSVQRITTELRPQVLDNLGLSEAIQWQAREYEKRTELEINFRSELPQTDFLNNDQSTTLFRIFQEAMNNVIRHAEASKVDIELKKTNEFLILSVEDNGIGITETQKGSPSSFGIIGMYERTRFLGGDVQINTKDGNGGTCVVLRIPLTNEKEL